MSWPDMVWRPQDPNADDMGMVPFSPPTNVTVQGGIDAGLPDDWQSYDGTVETVSAWDVLSNPLYEAAAGALDIDWQEFTNNFNETIGEEDLYERPEPTNDELFDAEAYQEALDEWNNDDDAGRDTKPDPDDYRTGRDGDDYYDWGITNSSIEGDLNNMQDWLLETIEDSENKKGYKGTGPSSKNYANIEGDIWEHFGLTEPPKAPEELGDEYFTYKDSPSNYDVAVTHGGGFGADNPWIEAGVWVGKGEHSADKYPFRGEKGATQVMWNYQKASGAQTVPPAKGAGPAHDWYLADRERNMPGNDLNPDNDFSPGNTLGQGGWDHRPQTTEATTTE